MRFRTMIVSLLLVSAAGCRSNSPSTLPTPQSTKRSYNGTASVGDFLTITLDSAAQTLSYSNHSNGDAGTIAYTLNSDGTYKLNDPAGNLLAAYEVPNYALLVQSAKTGPNHDTMALVTAVESGPISMSTLENHEYNYMEFRTAAGGVEVGSISIDPQGKITHSSYWPYGAQNQQSVPFNSGEFPANSFTEDPSGTFVKHDDGHGSVDYAFGTQNGIFAVDTGNGAILGLQKGRNKDFDPSFAGTYKAILYKRTAARTGVGNIETGTPSLDSATLILTAAGQVTLHDTQNNLLAQGTLTPVADTAYLVGSTGELADPCFGLFTVRVKTANSLQDVFLAFQGRAVLFSSFSGSLPANSGNAYDYFYGVALK
jgi:hypothetical protein